MNSALEAFTPASYWQPLLKELGATDIPVNPGEGTVLLMDIVVDTPTSRLRDAAHEIARMAVGGNLNLNYDDCYNSFMAYLRELQEKAAHPGLMAS